MRLAVFLLALPLLAGTTVVDAGSQADSGFTGGLPWTIASPAVSDATLRFGGSFSYRTVVAPGDYSVTLRFVEPTVTVAGARVFSVSLNGALAIDSLDLVAAAGYLTPYARTFPVSAIGGVIDIVFVAAVRSAVVSTIEITPLVAPPPPASSSRGCQVSRVDDKTLLVSACAAGVNEVVYRTRPLLLKSPGGVAELRIAVSGDMIRLHASMVSPPFALSCWEAAAPTTPALCSIDSSAQFAPDESPLAAVTMAGGVWQSNLTDWRADVYRTQIQTGVGLTMTQLPGATIIGLDSAK